MQALSTRLAAAAKVAASSREPVRLGVVFAMWFVVNVAINWFNKWVLSRTRFHFPLVLTCSNKLIGWLGALLVLRTGFGGATAGFPSIASLRDHFRRPLVHTHGVITALNIGLNNWSLLMLSITINQLIKSVVPLPTAALSVLLERKTYSGCVRASTARAHGARTYGCHAAAG